MWRGSEACPRSQGGQEGEPGLPAAWAGGRGDWDPSHTLSHCAITSLGAQIFLCPPCPETDSWMFAEVSPKPELVLVVVQRTY